MLRQQKYIADAAVVGVRRKDGHTEVPLAFIVRKPEPEAQSLRGQDVYSFVREQLASFKALDGGVVFVNAIPRSALGKIQRFKLKDMVGEESAIINGAPTAKLADFAKEDESGQQATEGMGQIAVHGSLHINGILVLTEDRPDEKHIVEESRGRNGQEALILPGDSQ